MFVPVSKAWLGDDGTPLFWARILVKAAAASSRAELTDDVSLLSTSGSAKTLPSASLPIPDHHKTYDLEKELYMYLQIILTLSKF